jgi:hypothetical protein
VRRASLYCTHLAQCGKPQTRKSKGKSQKAKIKNFWAGPWAGLGRDLRGLAAHRQEGLCHPPSIAIFAFCLLIFAF